MAKRPTYYVMERDRDMPATVRPEMPSAAAIAGCRWLPDEALAVYAGEYGRIGFKGGLQYYRVVTGGHLAREMKDFAGRAIEVPCLFIAGSRDWGTQQTQGAFDDKTRSAQG